MKSLLPSDRKRGVGKTTVATRLSRYLRQSGEQVLAAARRHPMLRTRPIQLDLDSLQSVGGPPMVPMGDIDEDPDQPRVEFDDGLLKELAATIAERGVRSPVSVRPHPKDPGRWMLNYGARRFRASKLAGLSQIPAFVDKAADSYDQVIENEQREGLKPLELALFVKRQLDKGVAQAEIARRLGKSQTYITFVRAMIDPPSWLMEVYRSGKCRNAAQLYELRRLHEADPGRVEKELDTLGRIGRGDIERLKVRGEACGVAAVSEALPGPTKPGPASPKSTPPAERSVQQPGPADSNVRCREMLVLTAEHEGRRVRVFLDVQPERTSAVYVTTSSKADRVVVDICALTGFELTRSPR